MVKTKTILVTMMGILVMNFPLVLNLLFSIGILINFLIAGVIVLAYAIFAFLVLTYQRQLIIRRINRPVYREIEKPVYVDREVEKPVYIDRPVYVDREVVKQVQVPVEKTVYISAPQKKKLVIPKYNFLGSTETQTYHQRNCRLGKLIKRKYKLSNNSESFFTKKGFKPCKVCIGE